MEFNDFLYKMRGIDPDAKKAYLSLTEIEAFINEGGSHE